MAKSTWSVASAKAKLSEVIARASEGGPQTITRNGREVAVVVSAADWQRRTKRKGSLADFLMSSPLARSGVDLEFDRRKDPPRKVDL